MRAALARQREAKQQSDEWNHTRLTRGDVNCTIGSARISFHGPKDSVSEYYQEACLPSNPLGVVRFNRNEPVPKSFVGPTLTAFWFAPLRKARASFRKRPETNTWRDALGWVPGICSLTLRSRSTFVIAGRRVAVRSFRGPSPIGAGSTGRKFSRTWYLTLLVEPLNRLDWRHSAFSELGRPRTGRAQKCQERFAKCPSKGALFWS